MEADIHTIDHFKLEEDSRDTLMFIYVIVRLYLSYKAMYPDL